MITYKIVWDKEGNTGSFTVTTTSDEECIKAGHKEVEDFGGEVTDYYQIAPSTKRLERKLRSL